jgi:hypothetical protein
MAANRTKTLRLLTAVIVLTLAWLALATSGHLHFDGADRGCPECVLRDSPASVSITSPDLAPEQIIVWNLESTAPGNPSQVLLLLKAVRAPPFTA